jgi:acetyl esterase/lipase
MTDRSVLDREARWPDAVVRYGEHDDSLLDLHLPEDRTAAPLVLLIHGGFWRSQWDRRHTRPMAEALSARGFVVATPEYRRTGAGGGWPATFEDVRSAVVQLPDLLNRVGLSSTPPRVVGHSAGGHLALWLASQSVELDRCVALAPVCDLGRAYERELDGGATGALMGGSPDEHPERYDAGDPMRRSTGDVPVTILHGTADMQVPLDLSRAYAEAHPGTRLVELQRIDHFALIDPESGAWPDVLEAVTS